MTCAASTARLGGVWARFRVAGNDRTAYIISVQQFARSELETPMLSPANHFRLGAIALIASVGMLSLAGEARAAKANAQAGMSGRSCCSSRVCPAGCCVRGGEPSRSGINPRSVAGFAARSIVTSTDGACDCRQSEPASPAARQESQTLKARGGSDPVVIASLAITSDHSGLLCRLIEPARRPPKSLLYLTTVRLLI